MNKLIWVLVSFLSASVFGKDYTPAEIKALLSSAEKGDAPAQYEYGVAHYHVAAGGGGYIVQVGLNGGTANPAEAAKWFLRAAEQGHSEACYSISRMYDSGVGVIKSGVEAEKWLKKAVQNSPKKDGGPEYTMGVFYSEDRPDLPKNEKEAAVWYRKAAVITAVDAPWIDSSRQALGAYYSNPKSAEYNLTTAYAWWIVAALSGNEYSAKMRDGVEGRLDQSKIKDGRALAGLILKEVETLKGPQKK
jgi:TPR repeat protein